MRISLQRVVLSELAGWVLLACIAVYMLVPLNKSLRFGMDLKGGTYLTLSVQVEKAIDAELVQKMQWIEGQLKKAHKSLPINKGVEKNNLVLSFSTIQAANDCLALVKDQLKGMQYAVTQTDVQISFLPREVQRLGAEAVARNIEVLQMRLDKIGVAEIPISAQGERNIVIELPDVFDTAQVKTMLGTVALLEFKLVDKVARTAEDLLYELDDFIPSDKELLPAREVGGQKLFYLVDKYAEVTGRYISDARAALHQQTSEPIVNFKLTGEGDDKFHDLAHKNAGKQLAIVLDGVVISAPTMSKPEGVTRGAEWYIHGSFSPEGARELALLLKSGSFVAPVVFEEERQVDPLLGAESIRQGLLSCLVGLLLLFAFAVPYYKWSGLAAFVALLFNLLLTLVGLSWLGATLTLPGIGGMVLSVGMAIDASILIFERVKELIAEGESPANAVKRGFSGAMTVILDANCTHLIVGMVLYQFGSGPIKGFAVTMILGIVATLITGLFFLRSIFNFVFSNFHVKKLSI